MARVECRRMQMEDLDAVEQIEALSFAIPWSRESFRMELQENRCALYMVLTHDDIAVAYGGAWVVIDEGHVTNIAVHPDYRGLGYGEAVTRSLMAQCAHVGVEWMTLEVRKSNAVAQNLYAKLGFAPVGLRKGYYEDNGEDALIMNNENIGKCHEKGN